MHFYISKSYQGLVQILLLMRTLLTVRVFLLYSLDHYSCSPRIYKSGFSWHGCYLPWTTSFIFLDICYILYKTLSTLMGEAIFFACVCLCARWLQFSSVQSLSRVQLFATPWVAACQASLSITNSPILLKLMSIEAAIPSNPLIFCHYLLLLPSIFPRIRVFSSESALHIRWPNNWRFSFSISPSNEYSGLISFRVDWFGLLAVQGTFKSLLQHHNLKASILQCSAFFMVQLSHPYMTNGKTTNGKTV